MHERLIESWLDSASERSYQVPFTQMLAAEGHRIVHSTRHTPIELGKDVITIAPDGTPCAYQLKGHPGGRVGLTEFRNIEPQLRDLTDLAISSPGVPNTPHRSYFVTNGQVEEDARLAIQRFNEANINAGRPERTVEVIQRGDLLDMAKTLGHALWPQEIGQINLLLQMLVEDGRGFFPFDRANSMLGEVLGLTPDTRPKPAAAELKRRITSAAVMTSLSLKNFEAANNHYASIVAWTQYACAVIATCERFGISFSNSGAAAVEIALTGIKDALTDLAQEATGRKYLVEGDALVDAAFYRARSTLIGGLLSMLWFWCERDEWPEDLKKSDLESFLVKGKETLDLWGEAAIPQVLYYYWFLKRVEAGAATDALLVQLVKAVSGESTETARGLPGPYWDFEAVARHTLTPVLGLDQDPLSQEAIGGRSYFLEGLLHLLVRANWKQTCIRLWPDVTRTLLIEFIPAAKWMYCLAHSDKGGYTETQPPHRKLWDDLVQDARSIRCEVAPAALVERPFLHALLVLVFPYRGTSDVIRSLGRTFDKTWFIADPID